MMRTQLITPHSTFLSANSYNAIVSIHGMVMIIATIIMVTGPFTNFIMPIMIGAKDMAFPRLNAMSFWVVVSAIPPLLATFVLGGVDAGWTTYAPLSVQAPAAMDAFSITMIVFVVSVTVAGVNTIVTIFTMRAKGMTLGRLPIFTWASLIGAALEHLRHAGPPDRLHRHDHRPGHRHLVLRRRPGWHGLAVGERLLDLRSSRRCTSS